MTIKKLNELKREYHIYDDVEDVLDFVSELLHRRAREIEKIESEAYRTVEFLDKAAYEVWDMIDYISELEEREMEIKNIDHVDDFGVNEYVCWAEVTGVPAEFIEQAKVIDGENYCESCFGICVGSDENGWFISQDDIDCELYYIDNNGDKHWMNYKLTKLEEAEAIEFCKKYVEEVE